MKNKNKKPNTLFKKKKKQDASNVFGTLGWADAYKCSMCWRRLLTDPWIARRSKQSILKEINPEYSLEGLTLKLKLQYFGHLRRRADSMGKTLMLGKSEGRRRRGQRDVMVGWHHQLNGHKFEQTPGDGEGQGSLVCCQPMGLQRVRHDWVNERQQSIHCLTGRNPGKWVNLTMFTVDNPFFPFWDHLIILTIMEIGIL